MGVMLIAVIELIIIFTVKVIDSVLGTGKTILIQKNRGVLAALMVTISQIIFYKLIATVISSESDVQMIIVSVGAGVGTYVALKINGRFSRDKTYVNIILSDDRDAMVKLREYLMENKITNLATDGYTKEWEKTIALSIYAETREHSKLVDKYIDSCEDKFKRVVYNK